MCTWLSNVDLQAGSWDIVDIFCGEARISKLASRVGYRCALVDVKLHKPNKGNSKHTGEPRRSSMDVNGESGFLLPGLNGKQSAVPACCDANVFWEILAPAPRGLRLRLCCVLLLQGKFGQVLAVLGTLCSSWTVVNMGTSLRSVVAPGGDSTNGGVSRGNKMVARTGLGRVGGQLFLNRQRACGMRILFGRTGLFVLLVGAMEAGYLIENPSTSLMFHYARIREAVRLLRAAGAKAG